MERLSFASLDYQAKKKRTKREKFLAEMDGVIPWSRLEALIQPRIIPRLAMAVGPTLLA